MQSTLKLWEMLGARVAFLMFALICGLAHIASARHLARQRRFPKQTLDMPADAVLEPAALKTWRDEFAAALRAMVDAVPISIPSPALIGACVQRNGFLPSWGLIPC
jgi:hypothetical protein